MSHEDPTKRFRVGHIGPKFLWTRNNEVVFKKL